MAHIAIRPEEEQILLGPAGIDQTPIATLGQTTEDPIKESGWAAPKAGSLYSPLDGDLTNADLAVVLATGADPHHLALGKARKGWQPPWGRAS